MTGFEILFKVLVCIVFCGAGIFFCRMAINELKFKNPFHLKLLLVFQIFLSFILFLMGAWVWSI